MNDIQFYTISGKWVLWGFPLVVAMCFVAYWVVISVRNRVMARAQYRELVSLMKQADLADDEKALMINLIQIRKTRRPTRILNSLREYDVFAETEMKALLVSKDPWIDRLRAMDRFYSIRDKVGRREALKEKNVHPTEA